MLSAGSACNSIFNSPGVAAACITCDLHYILLPGATLYTYMIYIIYYPLPRLHSLSFVFAAVAPETPFSRRIRLLQPGNKISLTKVC